MAELQTINILSTDLPITVAQKLITATVEISNDNLLQKSLNKALGGDGTRDMFTAQELKEIADYLYTYCKYTDEEVSYET